MSVILKFVYFVPQYTIFSFLADILSLVASQSLRYQKQGSTHIKEHGRQKEFLAMLKIAQQKKGDHLVQFLKECQCTDWKDPNGNHELQDCGTIKFL